MRLHAVVLLAITMLGLSTGAVATPTDVFLVDDYAAVVDAVVDEDGMVDYASLKAHAESLHEFTVSLDRLSPGTYQKWDTNAKIAFWINAYNALTLELVVDHYPIETAGVAPEFPPNSIRQIPGAWDTITFSVMGKAMTLDHIENAILRAEFDEPRIHMALVCAARSCPPLRREPYAGLRLNAQLDDQTRRFLGSPARFVIDRDAGVVRLSAIFDWFAGDFVEQYGKAPGRFDASRQAVISFIGRSLTDADRAYLETGEYRVEYLVYDWTLNERGQ